MSLAATPGLAPLVPAEYGAPESTASNQGASARPRDRMRLLRTSLEARDRRMSERETRADAATVDAEKTSVLNAAERVTEQRQAELSTERRPAIRDLELRLLALETQTGSLAAGPAADVADRIAAARRDLATAQGDLRRELALVRQGALASARERIEHLEADLERQRSVRQSLRASETEAAVRRYRGDYQDAMRGVRSTTPRSAMAEAHPVAPIPSAPVRGGDEAPKGPTGIPEGRLAISPSLRAALAADLRARVERLCLRRGWRVEFQLRAGLWDATAQIAEDLRRLGYGLQ